MTDDDPLLLDLADAVLEGRPLDWSTAIANASDSYRPLILDFQSVAAIASLGSTSAVFESAPAALVVDETGTQPATWGPLAILSQIGRGRFGDVYRAIDPRLDRPVALKLLRHHESGRSAVESAVIAEGRLMARVRHPNVVTVYGAERIDGRVGLWMELVDGQTLEEELREHGPLPEAQVAKIGIDLCRALAAIHRAGLLHRDLKAQNVLRDHDGRILVTDFGAGLDLTDAANAVADLAGTPLYLAPEIFSGSPATTRSDIYSLGVLLFHVLTNAYPISGRTLTAVRDAQRRRQRASLADARPDLDERFVRAIERALAFDPDERFADAETMEAALARLGSGTAAGEERGRLLAVVAAVVLALATGAAVIPDTGKDGGAPVVTNADRLRRVRLPDGTTGVPSRDGRSFPFVDVTGNVHTWEAATGRAKRLTEAVPGQEWSEWDSVMSPTGDRVAYAWRMPDETYELRVIDAAGTWPRVLVTRKASYQPVPLDWSRNGREILSWFRQKNGSTDLVLVPADGGAPRVLHTFARNAPESARLSPDGRFVAASLQVGEPASRLDLVLIPVDGQGPRAVLEGVAPFSTPTWMPDGRGIFFLRVSPDVQNSRDGWVVPVLDGRPNGDAVRVAPDLGVIPFAHITDDGALYRVIGNVSTDINIVPIDLTGATPAGAPTRVLPQSVGSHVAPAWSPDGTSLAYFTTRPAKAAGGLPLKTLTIQDMASGRARDLELPLSFLGGYTPQWSPDSRSVIVWGRDGDRADRFGYYRVDISTVETSAVVIIGHNNEPAMSQWSPDGRDFFYREARRGIVARAFATGLERVIVSHPVGGFRVAPDGASVAFHRTYDGEGDWTVTINVQPIGGAPRELVRATRPESIRLHTWTPDSRAVLYTTWTLGPSQPRLWQIPVQGGQPRDLRYSIIRSGGNEPNPLSLSPDGRRIAHVERTVEQELWITRVDTRVLRPR